MIQLKIIERDRGLLYCSCKFVKGLGVPV